MSTKQLAQFENLMSSIDLFALPWISPSLQTTIEYLSNFTKQTLTLWDQTVINLRISQYLGPMTTLFGNPASTPALQGNIFGLWTNKDHHKLFQLLQADSS